MKPPLIIALIVALSGPSSASDMEYVTLDPPAFEACMAGCDDAADVCLSDDFIDSSGISLCEETKLNCYRRCASREAQRRVKEAGHSLRCEFT